MVFLFFKNMKNKKHVISLNFNWFFFCVCYEIITQCWLLIIFRILEAWTITLCKWSTQKDTKYLVEMRIASFPVDKQWKKKKKKKNNCLALTFWLINQKKKTNSCGDLIVSTFCFFTWIGIVCIFFLFFVFNLFFLSI